MTDILQELKMAEDNARICDKVDKVLAMSRADYPAQYYRELLEAFNNQLKTATANRTGGMYFQQFKSKKQ